MKLEFLTIKIAILPTHSGDDLVAVTDSCNEHFRELEQEGVIMDWIYDPEGTDGNCTVEVAEPYVEGAAFNVEATETFIGQREHP